MQKVVVPMSVLGLLGSGLFFYDKMMSDEMVLKRLGYSSEVITTLVNDQPELAQKLIDDHRLSEDIEDYLSVSGFNYACYNSYVELAANYPELQTSDVVYVASFLDLVFYPTLRQLGYEEETINSWFSDPNFKTYMTEADLVTLNRLLSYAQATEKDINTLLSYVDYEAQHPTLKSDEIVGAIDEYQEETLPALKSMGYESEEISQLVELFSLADLKSLTETTLKPSEALELMSSSSFDASNFALYDELLNLGKNYSVTYALQYAKYQNVKNNFYEEIVLTPNETSLLVLVNQNYRLAEDYVPTDFVPVEVMMSDYAIVNTNYLRRDAADATELMFAKAGEAGYELKLRTGYISYSTQKSLYDQDVYELGLEYADAFNSRPGHSEHQTGLAIDITAASVDDQLTLEFANTDEGKWVLEHAHEYGFIIRYPEDRESEVGYYYEPYHLRYVGVEVATEIYENDWTFEDYVLNYGLLDEVVEAISPIDDELEQSTTEDELTPAEESEPINEEVEETEEIAEEIPSEEIPSIEEEEPAAILEDEKRQAIEQDSELSEQDKYEL